MTKIDLSDRISKKTGLPLEDCQKAVNAFMDVVKDALTSKDNVYLRGFGTFSSKERAQKVARDIQKNTQIIVPAHRVPHFLPSKEFKLALRD